MLDEKKFTEGMASLCEVYQREPSKLLMKAYYMVLQDLDSTEFMRGIGVVLRDRIFLKMPLPGEIREAVLGRLEDKATLAYDAFTRGKAQTGAYDSVSFEDKIIHAVVMAMGGWAGDQGVCMITEDEWKFRKKDFIDLYKAISRGIEGRIIPDKLIGLGEYGCSQDKDWARHMPPLKKIDRFGQIKDVQNQLPPGKGAEQIEGSE